MIYAFLAQGFEEIEAITVIDILRRAGKEVVTVGIGGRNITGAHGIAVTADTDDQSAQLDERLEMVFLPGGMPGTLNLDKSDFVEKALAYCMANDLYISAICAAPSVLGHKGVLEGKKASCYPGFEKELKGAEVSYDPVSVDGRVITSRGPATAMAFGLKLAEIIASAEAAKKTGEGMLCS
ncbi:MAG: DJ-1/PfpI family protein [Oscillospiraceae bacterium]|nr:DJ-1/PfpI family protein [Oscillospiraceae bacterium]